MATAPAGSQTLEQYLAKCAPRTPIFLLDDRRWVRPYELEVYGRNDAGQIVREPIVLMCEIKRVEGEWMAPIPLKTLRVPLDIQVFPSQTPEFYTFLW